MLHCVWKVKVKAILPYTGWFPRSLSRGQGTRKNVALVLCEALSSASLGTKARKRELVVKVVRGVIY